MIANNYDKKLLQNSTALELPGFETQRSLKGGAIYGPNASGKSGVIAALEALRDMVILSAKNTDPAEPIKQIEPFALEPSQANEPTAFGIVFVSDAIRYEYRVAATRERIWHESLRAFITKKEQLWYSRDWDSETGLYNWSPGKPTGYRRDSKREEFTLPNGLYLSKAISLGDTQLEPIFRWFRENLKCLDLSSRATLGQGFTIKQFDSKTGLAPRILALLRHADLGVQDARVHEEKPEAGLLEALEKMKLSLPQEMQDRLAKGELKSMAVELAHKGAKENIFLPWDAESAGTHRLFALAGPWLDILEKGHTVCIDELDTSMHPLMVTALLKLLFSSETNSKGAQVIFSTHNPLLLDTTLIRRDQVWFTDKNDVGESHLYPLTDYSPREGESLVRGYLAGRYGAIPFIPEGLLGSDNPIEPTEHVEDSSL